MQLSYNGLTTKYATLKQDIECAAKAGFTSIELREDKIQDYLIENSVASLVALLKENNLEVCTINSIEITQQNGLGEKFEELKEKLIWMCGMAKALGADSLVTAPLINDEGWAFNKTKAYLVDLYRTMSDVAQEFGVKLGFEIIALTGAMVPNLKSALEIIEEINRDNIGLCFDCFAFYGNSSKIETIKDIPAEKLFMVHLNDARKDVDKQSISERDRRFPGEGEIDLESVIKAIKDTGYDGAFSVELITPYVWEWEVAKAVNHGFETAKKTVCPVYEN